MLLFASVIAIAVANTCDPIPPPTLVERTEDVVIPEWTCTEPVISDGTICHMQCPDGYMKWGVTMKTCTASEGNTFLPLGEGICKDIDECAAGTHTCGTGGHCINSVGGYSCDCKSGYVPNDDSTKCWRSDACSAVDPCLNGATCVDGDESSWCSCAPGFSGDNCQYIACSEMEATIAGISSEFTGEETFCHYLSAKEGENYALQIDRTFCDQTKDQQWIIFSGVRQYITYSADLTSELAGGTVWACDGTGSDELRFENGPVTVVFYSTTGQQQINVVGYKSDPNECTDGSETCGINRECQNTLAGYDCFCDPTFFAEYGANNDCIEAYYDVLIQDLNIRFIDATLQMDVAINAVETAFANLEAADAAVEADLTAAEADTTTRISTLIQNLADFKTHVSTSEDALEAQIDALSNDANDAALAAETATRISEDARLTDLFTEKSTLVTGQLAAWQTELNDAAVPTSWTAEFTAAINAAAVTGTNTENLDLANAAHQANTDQSAAAIVSLNALDGSLDSTSVPQWQSTFSNLETQALAHAVAATDLENTYIQAITEDYTKKSAANLHANGANQDNNAGLSDKLIDFNVVDNNQLADGESTHEGKGQQWTVNNNNEFVVPWTGVYLIRLHTSFDNTALPNGINFKINGNTQTSLSISDATRVGADHWQKSYVAHVTENDVISFAMTPDTEIGFAQVSIHMVGVDDRTF
jgi:hypothetical protein